MAGQIACPGPAHLAGPGHPCPAPHSSF